MVRKFFNATSIFLLLVFVVIGGTAGVLYSQLRTDSVSAMIGEESTFRTLVVVHEDNQPFLAFLLFYDARTDQAAVLDIPGTVGAVLRPLGRVDSIDAVFDADDPQVFLRQVETLTGTSIPFTLVFSTQQLINFLDLMGGMELFIIADYREAGGADPMLLPSGSTRLDGGKAVRYLREYADAEADLEQVGRRQSFVHAFLREIQRKHKLLVHPDVVPLRDQFIVTDMESRAVTTIFGAIGRVDTDRIVRRRIQGTVRQVDVDGVTRSLLFPHFEGQWLRQTVQQIHAALATPGEEGVSEASIVVEVLNGTSRTGLARQTAELFEGYGFDVQNVGNADSNALEHTVIVDRRGIGDLAERVAEIIGGRRVITEVTPDSDVDVTVMLGGDFDGNRVRTD